MIHDFIFIKIWLWDLFFVVYRTVYGTDLCNRRVVRGYGAISCPTTPGTYVRQVRLFRPVSSSMWAQFMGWLTGNPAQFIDPRVTTQVEGRDVVRAVVGFHDIIWKIQKINEKNKIKFTQNWSLMSCTTIFICSTLLYIDLSWPGGGHGKSEIHRQHAENKKVQFSIRKLNGYNHVVSEGQV